MRYTKRLKTASAALVLATFAACGERQATDQVASAPQAELQQGNGAAATAARRSAIAAAQEGATLTLKVKLSMSAERSSADPDPLGARSRWRAMRSAELTCRVVASQPLGVGPDGPTPEQQAILNAAESQTNEAFEADDKPPAPGSLEARVEACKDDDACLMRVALEMAGDPQEQAKAEAEEARNAGAMASVEEAAARASAVRLEPNWQILQLDADGSRGERACEGTITVDDNEVYRLGFDGGDMGEGVEKRKGASELTTPPNLQVWYDLRGDRLIVDAQLGSVGGRVESVNVGGRKNSRNKDFSFNDEWAVTAGEMTRLEKRGSIATIPGSWTFTAPVAPDKHRGFSGKVEAEITVTPR
ncbi:MAG: hypothetical protein ACOYLK_16840 [Sphingomonas sp.]